MSDVFLHLVLRREIPVKRTTFGKLYFESEEFCRTLEDIIRADPDPATPENEAKVYGETAIPAGTYRLGLRNSPKFGEDTVVVLDVPGYDYIQFHSGVTHRDTLGCILVGDRIHADRDPPEISGGKVRGVLDRFKERVVPAIHTGLPVMLTVIDPPVPARA